MMRMTLRNSKSAVEKEPKKVGKGVEKRAGKLVRKLKRL